MALTYGQNSPEVTVAEEVEGGYYVYSTFAQNEFPAGVPFDPEEAVGASIDHRAQGESVLAGPYEVCFDAEEGDRLWYHDGDEWVALGQEAQAGRICRATETLGWFVIGPEAKKEPKVEQSPSPTVSVSPTTEDPSSDESPLFDPSEEPSQDGAAPGQLPDEIVTSGLGAPIWGLISGSAVLLIAGFVLLWRRSHAATE